MQELIEICQKTVSNLGFFPLYFISALGLLTFVFQIFKTNIFIKNILKSRVRIPLELKSSSRDLQLENKIDLIYSSKPLSFCYGFLNPRICLSTELLRSLTKGELKAVLLHESYHLNNFDPLKIILSSTLSSMLFFLPVFKDFHRHLLLTKEISADKLSIRKGEKTSLISVLGKFLNYPGANLNFVAALTGEALETRIFYLKSEEKFKLGVSKTSVFISIISIIILFLALNTPASGFAGGGSCYAPKNFSENLLYTPK